MLGLNHVRKSGPGDGVLYLYARDRGRTYYMENKTERTKMSGHRCRCVVSIYMGQGTDVLYGKQNRTNKNVRPQVSICCIYIQGAGDWCIIWKTKQNEQNRRTTGADMLYLYTRDKGLMYYMENKTERTKSSGHRCRYIVSIYMGQGTDVFYGKQNERKRRTTGADMLYLYAWDRRLMYFLEHKRERTKTSSHWCGYVVSINLGLILWKTKQNKRKRRKSIRNQISRNLVHSWLPIQRSKYFGSCAYSNVACTSVHSIHPHIQNCFIRLGASCASPNAYDDIGTADR